MDLQKVFRRIPETPAVDAFDNAHLFADGCRAYDSKRRIAVKPIPRQIHAHTGNVQSGKNTAGKTGPAQYIHRSMECPEYLLPLPARKRRKIFPIEIADALLGDIVKGIAGTDPVFQGRIDQNLLPILAQADQRGIVLNF